MFRPDTLRTSLAHLIGWRQSYDPDVAVLSTDLSQSTSGLYYQQGHPLITIPNMRAIAPNFDNIVYPLWDAQKSYIVGEKVDFSAKIYIATAESLNKAPEAYPEYWDPYDAMVQWLNDKTSDSMIKAITRIVNEKVSMQAAKKLVENKVLFDGAGRLTDIDDSLNTMVGFEVVPNRSRSIVTIINRIGLQFTMADTITMYLFHSSQSDPVETKDLVYTRANSMQWFAMDWALPYVSASNDAGGSWFICYNKVDLLPGNYPIYKSRDWSKAPCFGCDPAAPGFNLLSRYIEVYPFFMNEDVTTPVTMWNLEDNMGSITSNQGLNLELSVGCDITDFILTQQNQFADIILMQTTVDLIREMAYNPQVRVNRNALNASRTEVLYALDGDTASFKKSGLSYELDLAYKSISFNLEGIDRVCLQCKNGGIKYRTV